MKTDLHKLQQIIRRHFTPPFCPEGLVIAEFYEVDEGEDVLLTIQIGDRCVDITENLDVINTGMDIGGWQFIPPVEEG
jgi:hypothetical protein